MKRYCFLLQVRPELLEEYTRRHAAVWPEMLEALQAAGWHHYSIFARDDGMLVGFVEADDLAAAQAAMAATDVNARWQAEMSRFFVDVDGAAAGGATKRPDESMLLLTEVFSLEDSLARLG